MIVKLHHRDALCLCLQECDSIHFVIIPVNKQINDKERIAAALENPNLRELVDQCISNDFGWWSIDDYLSLVEI